MSRARVPVVVAAVVLPVLVLVVLVLRPVPTDPEGATIALTADPVVTEAVLDSVAANGSGTLDVIVGASPEGARALVEDGTLIAALSVDFETPSDTLYLAGANGSRVNAAVVAAVEDSLAPFDRTIAVQDVHPADVPQHLPGWIVAVGLLAGAVLVLARRWAGRFLRGSRPPRHLAEQIGTDALLYGVVLGAASFLAGLPGSPPSWIALGFLLVAISAAVTSAAVRVIGVWGLGVVAALFVLPTWVLARAPHPLLLPTPIETVGSWMPHGAAAEIAGRLALFGDGAGGRPWLVLLGWAVGGVLVLALTHRLTAPRASTEPAAIEG
ncbi:hypothetical protein [Aeromicrobium sp. Sec7.5]|uniref:hypothetical protein n=1 Tax=Aeromicrobium sp. Sec7.5 TaxID=3121276 RepID=UPI002FE4DE11